MALAEQKLPCKQLMTLAILVLVLINLPIITFAQLEAGHAFEDAEVLFRQNPRWLGADGAHSIRLDNQRIFWTFADTFVSTSNAHVRHESEMVRNTIAIQTGNDPLTATMKFYWQQGTDGSPASFFPEDGQFWYWPQASIRLDEGPLVTFLYRIVNTPEQGLGFDNTGYAISIVENPDAPPGTWKPEIINAEHGRVDAFPATALIRIDDYVVAVAVKQGEGHQGVLVRYSASSLAKGSIEEPEWWTGGQTGWVLEEELGSKVPDIVLDHAGSECSIHWDQRTGSFIHITTYGFGAATIGLRTATALTGPWSAPVTVYRPPESAGPRPFVYGAVAHPALVGQTPEDLIVTYATNSFEFTDMFTKHGSRNLYWPRVITVSVD
jgi:hypothetical protein